MLIVPIWLAVAIVDMPEQDAAALLDELISLRLVEAVETRRDLTRDTPVELVTSVASRLEHRHDRTSALDAARRRALDAVLRHVDADVTHSERAPHSPPHLRAC